MCCAHMLPVVKNISPSFEQRDSSVSFVCFAEDTGPQAGPPIKVVDGPKSGASRPPVEKKPSSGGTTGKIAGIIVGILLIIIIIAVVVSFLQNRKSRHTLLSFVSLKF